MHTTLCHDAHHGILGGSLQVVCFRRGEVELLWVKDKQRAHVGSGHLQPHSADQPRHFGKMRPSLTLRAPTFRTASATRSSWEHHSQAPWSSLCVTGTESVSALQAKACLSDAMLIAGCFTPAPWPEARPPAARLCSASVSGNKRTAVSLTILVWPQPPFPTLGWSANSLSGLRAQAAVETCTGAFDQQLLCLYASKLRCFEASSGQHCT